MILVTGGAGVMGKRLVHRLASLGHTVRVLTLPGDSVAEGLKIANVEIVYGDITRPDSLAGLANGIDTVYHLAAVILSPMNPDIFMKVNFEGTSNILSECERAKVNHFVYISSASVVYERPNSYSLSKKKAEEIVKASTVSHYTIVRPTLAYEKGGAEEFRHFTDYLLRFPVVPLIGNGAALKSPVYVEDIINGLVAIAGNSKSFGKIYNFSGGSVLSLRRMAEMILAKKGCNKLFVPIPVFVCRLLSVFSMALAKCTGKKPLLTWQTISGVTQNANLDYNLAAIDLGYKPRSFEDGLSVS
jgi:NADH dehydrogenase